MMTWARRIFGGAEAQKAAGKKRSPFWSGLRDGFLKANPFCAACGGTKALSVHHVRPFCDYPKLELDANNLMTLCEKPSMNCHLWVGHAGSWRTWNPGARQDARWFRRIIEWARKGREAT